ncbi:MATE family efflux transporter [Plastoroseomonas arctica]|uniref:Multidrug-efflux transporter n=1 Tax=Plastoroseomonas arctica TaxID=1509237 RepID=A0AAF1K5B8_9PROT|nr:MATE family efflux transporter [Plastoroseomonas arctica]MBR0656304.1 MATE family efflux transporter [Plastoroseomonas arctica]
MPGHTPQRAAILTETRALLALAFPIALTNLSQMAMALTDALILGRLSTEALAAVTLGTNLSWALLAPAFGMALAAAPMLAQSRGAGTRGGGLGRGWVREMRRDARQALWAVGIVTLPSWAILWNTEALLLLLGQEPALAALAGTYVRPMMLGFPAFCLFILLRGFLAAMEKPNAALWIAFAAVAVNGALCWTLVFGLGLGIFGAGIATMLAEILMAAALLWLIRRDRRLRRFRLLGLFWRIDTARLAEVFRVGLPIAAQMMLEIGVFATALIVVGWFGAASVAAHAIAIQLASFTFMVPMGVGQAATSRVGLFAGAGALGAASLSGSVAIGLGAMFMAMTAAGLLLFAEPLAWGFLDPQDAQARSAARLGATLIMIAGVFQLADGVQTVAAGALRGLKDTQVPMLLAALGYWGIGLPLGVALAMWAGLEARGVWWGLALGLGVVAVLMLLRWRRMSAPIGSPIRSGAG